MESSAFYFQQWKALRIPLLIYGYFGQTTCFQRISSDQTLPYYNFARKQTYIRASDAKIERDFIAFKGLLTVAGMSLYALFLIICSRKCNGDTDSKKSLLNQASFMREKNFCKLLLFHTIHLVELRYFSAGSGICLQIQQDASYRFSVSYFLTKSPGFGKKLHLLDNFFGLQKIFSMFWFLRN